MANAQVVIDIAAAMPAGEQTIAQLDQITAGLVSGGKGAEHFQQAIVQVSSALEQAQAASARVAESLTAAEAEYAQLERAALQAAKAEEKAAMKGVVPPDVARTAREAQAAVDAYAVTLGRLETEAKQATAEEDRLAQSLANVKKLSGHVDKSFNGQAEKLGKLQGALGQVGGPLGTLGSRLIAPIKGFTEMSGAIGSARTAMIFAAAGGAILVASIVAITAAVVAGTIAIAAWAVGLADAARNAGLARDAAEAMNPGIAALRGDIDALDAETGLGTDKLRALAKGLQDAGESSDAMAESLRVTALAEKALGAEGSAAYTGLVKAAADATIAAEEAAEKTGAVPDKLAAEVLKANAAVDEFAANAKSKLGPIVAQQMRGLDAQSKTLKKNIGQIFGGLDIEPVLDGMSILVGLFDKNTAAGQAMKFLFESVFQPIIDQARNAALVVEAFAIGFLIGLTKVYIALKPVIRTISDLFGFDDTSLTDTLTSAKGIGETASYVFVGVASAFAAVLAAVAAVVAPIVSVTAAIGSLIGMIYDVNVAILGGFITAWNAAKSFLGSLPASVQQIGLDIVRGMAAGITGGASIVVEALGGVVNSAINSAKNALGIHSPSKVFAGIGEDTTAGFAVGVEDEAPAAQDALQAMVEPPAAATAGAMQAGAAAASGAGAGGGGKMIDLSGSTWNISGVKDAESVADLIAEKLTRILEGDASQAEGDAVTA
jgi:hypothetical protein